MKKMKVWFVWNKLSLNVSKTKLMLFVNANVKIHIQMGLKLRECMKIHF